jgi:hypothetical protein
MDLVVGRVARAEISNPAPPSMKNALPGTGSAKRSPVRSARRGRLRAMEGAEPFAAIPIPESALRHVQKDISQILPILQGVEQPQGLQ